MLPHTHAGREDSQVLVHLHTRQPRHRRRDFLHQTIGELLSTQDKTEPEKIINVNNVLNELIEQSVALVGKPVALMNKADKVRAIRFLNESGAFLVTKSGDKVAKYFGISKYTLYSYIDTNKQQEEKK